MIKLITILIPIFIVITAVSPSGTTAIFRGNNVSLPQKSADTITKKFSKHGLLFIDKVFKKKIVLRLVYENGVLIYRYPVTIGNKGHTDIRLISGRKYLQKGIEDTIVFSNNALPVMSRHVYATGATISRVSDSTYRIRDNGKDRNIAKFYIAASDNFEEIKNRPTIICDSLLLPVKQALQTGSLLTARYSRAGS